MTVYQYNVAFFCSESTPERRSGSHSHTMLYVNGLGPFSWGTPEQGFRTMGPASRRSGGMGTQLPAGVCYHVDLGYGHVVLIGTTIDTDAAAILAHGTTWAQNHQHGGQYPDNCRGAVDDFLTNFSAAPTSANAITHLDVTYRACR
jgi:hypothetical protein